MKTIQLIFIALILISYNSVNGQNASSAEPEIQYCKSTYVYKTIDDHKIRADVYQSPGKNDQPVVIWIHGGALIFGNRNWLSNEQLETYLNAGYTVVSVDYRLAPETKLAGIIEDLEDAYVWLRTHGSLLNVNPDQIAVVGHSAGGYLTLMAGFRLDPRPKALISFYGYGDITGPWYSQPDSFYNQRPTIQKEQALASVGDSIISGSQVGGRWQFYRYCRQKGLWPKEVSGHDPVKEHEWYSDYEPLRNVTSSYPPTILLHGEKDTDVPFKQSVMMAEALLYHGVDHKFITNPDWGHGFDGSGLKDPEVKEAFDHILQFLDKYLK